MCGPTQGKGTKSNARDASTMLNDTERAPAAEHLDALQSHGVVRILWRRRKTARDLIIAA